MNSEWTRKADHRLVALVAEDPRSRRRVSVFARFRGEAASLGALGFTAGTVAGDVAAGSIELRDVPQLAAAEDVEFVELMRPAHPD